jgi:hypothetical protein
VNRSTEETILKIRVNICRVLAASAASIGCSLAFANQPVPSESISPVTDTVPALQAAEQESAQDQAKGFIGGSHLNLSFRSYFDRVTQEGGATRQPWVLGNQAIFTSGFTRGTIGFGADLSLFSALKLSGGRGLGDMVHTDPHGGGGDRRAWSYLGVYDVKARASNTILKYGAQLYDQPFLVPHDNRALPATFLGAALISNEMNDVTFKTGSITKTIPRGQTGLQPLRTENGGVFFDRLSYAGVDYQCDRDTKASLHVSRAQDVWDRVYFSTSHSVGDVNGIKWTGLLNYYRTQNQGASRQGRVNLNTYSLALSGQHRAHTGMIAFQQILGDQFFDYLNQSAGDLMSNSMDVDYNAPHEKSLQLRYGIDMKYYGVPGLSFMTWGVKGWDADAGAMAGVYADPNSSLHTIYWKNGEPIHGSHWELGLMSTYVVQSGRMKDSALRFTYMHHKAQKTYLDNSGDVYRLVLNVPVNIF